MSIPVDRYGHLPGRWTSCGLGSRLPECANPQARLAQTEGPAGATGAQGGAPPSNRRLGAFVRT